MITSRLYHTLRPTRSSTVARFSRRRTPYKRTPTVPINYKLLVVYVAIASVSANQVPLLPHQHAQELHHLLCCSIAGYHALELRSVQVCLLLFQGLSEDRLEAASP
jgi:hypothetical protein